MGAHVVDEAVYTLVVTVVILDGHFEEVEAGLHPGHIYRLGEERFLVAVEIGDECAYAARILELLLRGLPLVRKDYINAVVEKGYLPHPLDQYLIAEIDRFEKLRVRPEVDLCPRLRRIADHLKIGDLLAPFVALRVDLASPAHLRFEVFGKGVDDRQADAVQARREFIAVLVELAARMELRKHYLQGRHVVAVQASTGIPLPLSSTETLLSLWIVTEILSQWPSRASSTLLSTSSYTRWWSPSTPVLPMYIDGTFRTASSPSSIFMLSAPYSFILDPYWHNNIFVMLFFLALKEDRSVS